MGGGEFTKEGKEFAEALKQYAGTIDKPIEVGNLIFLMMAVLDVEEDVFYTTVTRIYKTAIEIDTGIDVDELINTITKSKTKNSR